MDNAPPTSGTPRKRKLATSNVSLRAWDHILENCTPLNSTSRRRSPVKVVRPAHTEYPPALDAYDALKRGVRELLLPETTPEIHMYNPFTTGARQENICVEPPCDEPNSSADVAIPPTSNRSALNPASPSVLLQTDSPAPSLQIKVRRHRLISDSGSSAATKALSRSGTGSPIITRAPLQQSPLPNATVPSSRLPSTPPSPRVPFVSSLSKIRVVRGRIESDSESSDGETRNSNPFLLTRTLNVIPIYPATLDVPVRQPSPFEPVSWSTTTSHQTPPTSSQTVPQTIDISSDESSHPSKCETTMVHMPSSTQTSSSNLSHSKSTSTLVDDSPAASKAFLFPYQSPGKKWTDGLSSPEQRSRIDSDTERSEYSASAGILRLDLPKGYRKPYSPTKCAVPQQLTSSVPFSDGEPRMPGTFPSFNATTSPSKPGGAIISIHSDSDEDSGGIGVRPRVPCAGERKGKRMSVWSVMDQAEVISISSSSSSSENDSDDDEPARRRMPVPLLRPPFRADSSTPKSQPKSTPRKNVFTVPPASRRTPQKSTTASVSAVAGNKKQGSSKAHLMEYALELYHSLNTQVFGNRLPRGYSTPAQGDEAVREMCEIVWSKTLTTTAGRAITKKVQGLLPDGQHRRKIMIELATKVVDSHERVRHTLSHEMCHLAVWLIDQGKDGGHGRAFKVWAARVMKVRRDIEITSTHAYQITYKFEWKCKSCGQVYGRHSKSINLADQRCGVCKGQLLALFEESKSTGWGAFLKEHLQSFKASRPGLSHGEAMKELGKLWREREAGNSAGADGAEVDALATEFVAMGLGGADSRVQPP